MSVSRAITFGLFALAFCASSADTEETAPVSTEQVYACASIAGDTERLACYDQAVGRLKQAEEAGEIRTVSRQDVDQVQRDSFGLSLPSLPRLMGTEDEIREVRHLVETVAQAPDGSVIVTLDNGQVWQQLGNKSLYLRDPAGQSVSIKRAAFGSFRMKIGNGRTFRVRRVE